MSTGLVASFFDFARPEPAEVSACPRPTPTPSKLLDDSPDEVLMASFCAGVDAAFEVLFDRHADAIHRHLFRLTHDRAAATDLTQVTFLSVVKGRDRFVPGSRFRVWLYVIAMNAWRDHRRRTRRELLSRDGTLPEEVYEPKMRDPGLEREVRAALARLPDIQREAVILHQLEDFSFKEIAEMLGLTESAAKVRAHRGYERLRALLGDTWSGRG